MEKLANRKFDASQILNDDQNQNIFGGTKINTEIGTKKYTDEWNDKNHNKKIDKGDTITILSAAAAPPPPESPSYTLEELEASEAEIIYEN